MTEQLTTQNATITTATIEIQALTIGRKQVTQSVFRQLPEEPLIAEDGTLNGTPWGTVNYHPDKCGDNERKHWHVVWQRGTELRRSRITRIPEFDPDGKYRQAPATFHVVDDGMYLASCVLEWLAGRREHCPLRRVQHTSTYRDELTYMTGYGFPVWMLAPEAAVDLANKHAAMQAAKKQLENAGGWPGPAGEVRQRLLDKAEAEFGEAKAVLAAEVALTGQTPEDLFGAFEQACADEAERRERHRALRDTIAQLPQLFIAV